MKQMLPLLGFLFLSLIVCSQAKTSNVNKLRTSKYAGFYSYGTNAAKGRVGSILIYPETDSTVLFYIDLNRGAPSYNMGSLYGRVKIFSDTGIFYQKFDYAEQGCKWNFHFTKTDLTIKTINSEYECGLGHAVYADGKFKRRSTTCEDFFDDLEGKKVYFTVTKPEDYNK